jgi:radical SAM protein with 4Fe4S-binding SPASM domain
LYCYEYDKSNKDTFNLERVKQKLSSFLSQKTEKGTIIDFHGGEPFLSFNKIRELCEWAWEQEFPESFLFFVTTNGTLIHGEVKDWLLANKDRFIVGLSLDGTREMHNINRSNSYDDIDIDFFFKTWPEQGIKMTISPQTIASLSDGIIDIHKKGCKSISANLAELVDWSSPEFLEVYRKELAKLAAFYLQNPNIEKCSLFDVHFPALLKTEPQKWCGAGTDMKVMDVDGREYPCHLFFDWVCGKEKSEKSHSIDFSDPKNYISSHCKECKLLQICPTCYGSNYIARGDIASRDLSLCELHKVRFAEVAKYEYSRIVEDKTPLDNYSIEEKYERLKTLEAIETVADVLKL